MSESTIESTEEAVAATQAAAWSANVKAVFDQHLHDIQREKTQWNDWHALSLEQARQNQQIVNRLAQDAATISARLASEGANFTAALQMQQIRAAGNNATIDNIALVDGITNLKAAQIARDSMMSDVAMDLKNVAGQAVETAQAAQTAATAAQAAASGFGVVSGPVPQGTTGVSQGGMQLGYGTSIESLMATNATATNAILASIAELNKAVSMLIVKVTGDVAVAQ